MSILELLPPCVLLDLVLPVTWILDFRALYFDYLLLVAFFVCSLSFAISGSIIAFFVAWLCLIGLLVIL